MWTWDSVQITHDQTCWTYDGNDSCAFTGGGSDEYKYATYADLLRDKEGVSGKIIRDDAEILEFINITLSKGLI